MGTISGSTKTHTTLVGTAGNDLFLVPAAFTTIDGEGGSDTVQADADYDTVNFGTPGDGETGSETLMLGGPGNFIQGGDQDFTVVDTTGGFNTFDFLAGPSLNRAELGNPVRTVQVASTGNTITLDRGQNNLTFTGGGNAIYYDLSTIDTASTLAVTLAGTDNTITGRTYHPPDSNNPMFESATVSGGTGASSIEIASVDATVTTDGFYNFVAVNSDTAVVYPGSGHDKAGGIGGNVTIHLRGTNNVVTGGARHLTVDGGQGSDSYLLTTGVFVYDGNIFVPPYVNTITAGGANNKFGLRDVDINTVTTGTAGASVSIYSVDDLQGTPTYPGSTITFAGMFNSLNDQGEAGNTIMGGTGEGTFILGSGNSTLTTSGSGNVVTAGAGQDTITPGSDHSTVTLNGTDAHLMLQGDGNAVFLNSGASGSINGVSPNLHVTIAPGIGTEIINGLASDTHAVFTVAGDAGGYTNTSAIEASLEPDGRGGTLLPFTFGSIDFAGIAPSHIAPSMFVIRS